MSDIFALQKLQKKQNAKIDKDLENLISGLEKVYHEAERKLIKLLSNYKGDTIDASFALQNKRNIENILTESGYYEVVEDFVSEFSQTLKTIKAEYELLSIKPKLSEAGKISIQALNNVSIDAFALYERDVAQTIYNGILRTALTNVPLTEAISAAQALLQDLSQAGKIRTIAETKYMEFIRGTEAIIAKDAGYNRFLYAGPIDDKIRPFCLDRVYKIYTRDEIDSMNNGQIDEVFISGGGYNCRHKWIPVPDDFALTETEKNNFDKLRERVR